MLVKKLLEHFAAEGCSFFCSYPGEIEPDYFGPDPKAAYEALSACDEMCCAVFDKDSHRIGWFFVVLEDGQPELVDHTVNDPVSKWIDENEV